MNFNELKALFKEVDPVEPEAPVILNRPRRGAITTERGALNHGVKPKSRMDAIAEFMEQEHNSWETKQTGGK